MSVVLGGAAVATTPIGGWGAPLHTPPVVSNVAGSTTANAGGVSTVSWAYSQADGDPQAFYRVQAQNSGATVTYHDTGWLAGATTSYGFDIDDAGVPTNSATILWSVSVQSTVGPSYTDTATGTATYSWGNPQCTVATVEGLAVTGSQVTVGQVEDLTVVWSLSDGSNTQTAYRIQLRLAEATFLLVDSGWVTSTGTTYDLPFVLTNGSSYNLLVQLKNNYGVRSS